MSDDPYRDCRRNGLRCVDCLTRVQWCDLCTERYSVTVALPNEPWPFAYVCLGWADLVNRLVADLDAAAPGWRVTDIKEKFGGLRFGTNLEGLPEEQRQRAHEIIAAAEAESYRVCDICGDEGSIRSSGGWRRVRCNSHADTPIGEAGTPEAYRAEIDWPEGTEYRWP